MGKKSSIAFGIIGIVLVVVAIVWWLVIGPALVKLPNDINTQMNFEGKLTQYIDSATQQPLPAGQELVVPFTVLRTFAALPDLYTSSVAVCNDSIVMSIAGEQRPAQLTQYALDRKTRKCVESTENWAYTPQIVLNDRVGYYGPMFPGGLKVGDTLTNFFSDVNREFDVKVVEKIDNFEGTGITAMKIDAARPAAEYYPPIAQVFLGAQGLPMEITFPQLSAQLKAKGLDLDTLMAGLSQVAAPEDMQALQAMTQQPVKIVYTQSSNDVIYVEEKTGATVGATFDRTTLMQVDTSGLLTAFAVIGKYASDPTVGPAIAAVMQAAGGLAQAQAQPVFNQNMSIIKTSEASLAQDAKDKLPLLALATLWIPVIIVVIGGLLLIVGVILMLKPRKPAAAGPSEG